MKFRLQGSVTIPKRPSTVGGLIGWARAVNKTLQELRDRKIVGAIAKAKAGSAPLKLTIQQGTAQDKFQIIPGTVNSEMPTLDTVALDDSTPPEITVTADTWVWVKCVGTFGSPDSYVVTIETSTTEDVPSGTDITSTGFTSFRGLGRVDFTAGPPNTFEIINVYSGGDLGVDSYGSVNHWWKQ
jgi:hypothetical protein